ncbi:polysaccharide biosynthesis protein [Halosquirtibacter xylanolyticus]|uniref:polysaccharide biosynthesis protein n=1 Tax=Halosquirtibacter xylanolyticus TaxID=3374599 RepID=UPI003747BD5F|nr:polysaccharide biosynthesis protein [Prolixibacteraceae bacterium]
MKKRLTEYWMHRFLPKSVVLGMDMIVVAITFVFTYFLRFNLEWLNVDVSTMYMQTGLVSLVYLIFFLGFKPFSGVIRHTTFHDGLLIVKANLSATIFMLLVSMGGRSFDGMRSFTIPYSVIIVQLFLVTFLLIALRVAIKVVYHRMMAPAQGVPVAIFGAGSLGMTTMEVLRRNKRPNYRVVAFMDDLSSLKGKAIDGVKVVGGVDAIGRLVALGCQELIISVHPKNLAPGLKNKLANRALELGIKVKEAPDSEEWIEGSFGAHQIREVKVEDLLERSLIDIHMDRIAEGLAGSVVMVTGAAGSIGSEIVRQIISFEPKLLLLVDQAESALYDLQNEIKERDYKGSYHAIVTDVSNRHRMTHFFDKYRPTHVFHAAAYKHVPLMEEQPYEAVRVNIGSCKTVADLSIKYGVSKFVMVSTDKAVNPTNVMGASKRICEMYVQGLASQEGIRTQFVTTRFGNVLGSNGSVVPLFQRQIRLGGPVCVTHKEITRYFMTIPEACRLVLEAGFMGQGGEIYLFDMGSPVKIYELAKKMIRLHGLVPYEDIDIKVVGLRPGEKLYEELLANKENTQPTHHEKIMIAKVRSVVFKEVQKAVESLLYSIDEEGEDILVAQMKALVPEFVSNNSVYAKLDPPKQQVKVE